MEARWRTLVLGLLSLARFARREGRDNFMIKVTATPEGRKNDRHDDNHNDNTSEGMPWRP
jgi:hypothetical protein